MRRYLWLIALCLFTLSSVGQTFKGRVADVNGNPISYAALYIKELSWGFTTDDDGCFQTSLKPGQYTCEISSLGYTGQRLVVQIPVGGLEKNVVLAERIYSLSEVNIVRGSEDPAYAVMRKAIAHAPYFRTQVKSFRAGTYLKGTGKVKSIPAVLKLSGEVRKESKKLLGKLFLLEEQREVTFKAPDVWENRVKAYSNTFPEEIDINIGLTTINFYEPTVFGKVSPLAKGAFSYYRFKLEACYAEGNRLINKIQVIPKKDHPRLVSGDLYIVDDLWCVSAARLSVRMPGMKASIKVTCKEVQPSVFLATSTSMESVIDMMGFEAEATYLAAVHYASVEVGEHVKKTIDTPNPLKSKHPLKPKHKYERRHADNRANQTTDSLADKKDSLYWVAIRSVPLKPEEVQSYINKEKLVASKGLLGKDSVKAQSTAGKILQAFFMGATYKTKNKKTWISLYGLPSYVPEYNFVDGFWLGARLEIGHKLSEASDIRFIPSLHYTTARKSWVGEGKIILDYAPRRKGKLELSGGVLSADYNGEGGESRLINSVASSLFGRNDMKLYDKRFLTMEHDIEPANGLLFSASVTWQQRKMLENHISRSWFKREAEPNIPGNESFVPMPENELLKASFALEYTPAHYYRMIRGKKVYDKSRFPTFTLRYDRAFSMEGTKPSPSYHLTEFSAKQNVEFGMFNSLYWYVNAGAFWNKEEMQFPDFKHFSTTHLPFTERTFDSGFSLLDNYAYSTNTRWTQANVSWYTPYLLLKYLPFLRKKNFDEALHLRSLVVYGRQPYLEAGYSVGLSDMARVGVFVGFDRLKFRSAGVSVSIPLSMFK